MLIVAPPSADRATVERNLAKLAPHARFVGEMLPALWAAAVRYGLDPVGVVAQAYRETGGGAYTGKVLPGFYNTAGIKNRASLFPGVDDGDLPLAHARFANWDTGAEAHAQHLAAYTGMPLPGRLIVDPRYVWVTGQQLRHFSELGGKWAPSPTYGTEVETLMGKLAATEPAPVPDPDPAPDPDPTPDPPPTPASIWAEHVGFGNPELTNPAKVAVTSSADSGPGSLRNAIAGNAPKHVTFASDMTITVTDELRPGSNTLIDGRGRNIVIRGTKTNGGFLIEGVQKVTLVHLAIRDCGNLALTGSNDPYDAILINGSSDVWLHHLDLSRASDKAVAVQRTTGVTVSWNHFHDQEQTFQIGDQTGGEALDSKQTVTVHHNYFDGTGYRHPVLAYGRAHVYNNYLRDWATYGTRSQRLGKMHFERNVLLGVRNGKATLIDTPGNGCNDAGTRCDDREGFLTLAGNVALPGSVQLVYRSTAAGTTFDPAASYAYTAETANQALANAIVAGVGPN